MLVRGKLVEDFGAIAFRVRDRVAAVLERRVSREREQVGWAHRIHDPDGGFAVFDADVHVEAEDKVSAGDDSGGPSTTLMIPRVGIDFLLAPVGEGMSGAGDEQRGHAR